MEFVKFLDLIHDMNNFTVEEADAFELMNEDELTDYQNNLEKDAGELSEWDHLRAFLTMKEKVRVLEFENRNLEMQVDILQETLEEGY